MIVEDASDNGDRRKNKDDKFASPEPKSRKTYDAGVLAGVAGLGAAARTLEQSEAKSEIDNPRFLEDIPRP